MNPQTGGALWSRAALRTRALLTALALFAVAACGPSNQPVPPKNLSIAAQTQVTYSSQEAGPNAWATESALYLTVRGQGFAKNAQIVIEAAKIPVCTPPCGLPPENITFGTVTADSNGAFLFVTQKGCQNSDTTNWNTDVLLVARQPSTGWFATTHINGGVFVCCNNGAVNETYSVTMTVPPWEVGLGFSCPQLPPPSGGGGGGGGGLGGCSGLGAAGCGCKSGGGCNANLICLNGSECVPCGGYSQQCCANNVCSSGYQCQFSPPQNSYTCLP